jgi:phosphohistidine phosphatase
MRIIAVPMKTLYIMRHAKSSWADAAIADFDRPLNDRGAMAAPLMGQFISEKGVSPSVILSSPAVRARQTARLFRDAGKFTAEIEFVESIYEASEQTLCHIVSEIEDSLERVMLVGHNPGVEGFIGYLTGQIEPMPTGAFAVIELSIGKWLQIDVGCGVLKTVYRPKSLNLE